MLAWRIAEGYYLYREYLAAENTEGATLALETPSWGAAGLPGPSPGPGARAGYARCLTASSINTPLSRRRKLRLITLRTPLVATLAAGAGAAAIAGLAPALRAQNGLPEPEEVHLVPDARVMGTSGGDVTIVEYFEYQCPYCKTNQAPAFGLPGKPGFVIGSAMHRGALSEAQLAKAVAAARA